MRKLMLRQPQETGDPDNISTASGRDGGGSPATGGEEDQQPAGAETRRAELTGPAGSRGSQVATSSDLTSVACDKEDSGGTLSGATAKQQRNGGALPAASECDRSEDKGALAILQGLEERQTVSCQKEGQKACCGDDIVVYQKADQSEAGPRRRKDPMRLGDRQHRAKWTATPPPFLRQEKKMSGGLSRPAPCDGGAAAYGSDERPTPF